MEADWRPKAPPVRFYTIYFFDTIYFLCGLCDLCAGVYTNFSVGSVRSIKKPVRCVAQRTGEIGCVLFMDI